MFLVTYLACLLFCVWFVFDRWSKESNKIKLVIGFIVALLPVANILLSLVILSEWWTEHRDWK